MSILPCIISSIQGTQAESATQKIEPPFPVPHDVGTKTHAQAPYFLPSHQAARRPTVEHVTLLQNNSPTEPATWLRHSEAQDRREALTASLKGWWKIRHPMRPCQRLTVSLTDDGP